MVPFLHFSIVRQHMKRSTTAHTIQCRGYGVNDNCGGWDMVDDYVMIKSEIRAMKSDRQVGNDFTVDASMFVSQLPSWLDYFIYLPITQSIFKCIVQCSWLFSWWFFVSVWRFICRRGSGGIFGFMNARPFLFGFPALYCCFNRVFKFRKRDFGYLFVAKFLHWNSLTSDSKEQEWINEITQFRVAW